MKREKNHFLNFFHVFEIFCFFMLNKKIDNSVTHSHSRWETKKKCKILSIGGIWGWEARNTWMQKKIKYLSKVEKRVKWIFECFRLILKVFLWFLSWAFQCTFHVFIDCLSPTSFSISQSKWKMCTRINNQQSKSEKRAYLWWYKSIALEHRDWKWTGYDKNTDIKWQSVRMRKRTSHVL